VSRAQAFSIEDQFVDAVRGVFGSEPVWSTGPVILPSRAVQGDVETAEFVDSSYMTRATYNLRANDLRITLRNGEILRVAPISVEYWDRLLAAPSKGRFFLQYIKPCHNVERINAGWLIRVYDRFKSRLQIM
jgi:KTSC domain